MAEIIQFPQKEEEERQYSFNINKDNYLLHFFPERNVVAYAKIIPEENGFSTEPLPLEENQRLFEETFPFFFIQVEDKKVDNELLPYALLVYFDFEGEKYATYYFDDEESDDFPILIFQIIDKNVSVIENPFQLKKVMNFFEETYRIEWFS